MLQRAARRCAAAAATAAPGLRPARTLAPRASTAVVQSTPLQALSGLRWCSKSADDDFFSCIDDKTFKHYHSKQVNLVRKSDGRRVALIPMSHLASPQFYDSVLAEIETNKYYLVLIEGVLDNLEALQREDQLALALATDADYREQMTQVVKENKQFTAEEEESLFEKTFMPYKEGKAAGLVHQELYFKSHLLVTAPLKMKNSDVTRETILKIEDAKEQEFFLLHKRSEHCGKVLREYLDQPLQEFEDCPGADTIAVCWGSAHCGDLADDLLTRGFEVESVGPTRDYGWPEDLYYEVAHNYETSSDRLMSVINGAPYVPENQ